MADQPNAPAVSFSKDLPVEDRRVHTRVPAARPAKLLHVGTARFIPATTSNVSRGGALLCLTREKPVKAGDQIEVAIDWDDSPVISENTMVRARVVRVIPIDHTQQAVAVCYEQPSSQQAGLRAVA